MTRGAPEVGDAGPAAIEFELPVQAVSRLLRAPALARLRAGHGRGACTVTWHDTAAFALAASGLSLASCRRTWRLERLRPIPAAAPLPATPPLLLGEGANPQAAGAPAGTSLEAVASFHGEERRMALVGPDWQATLVLRRGTLRGPAGELPCARLSLHGEAAAVASAARAIAPFAPLRVPAASLAAMALGPAHGAEEAADASAPLTLDLTAETAFALLLGRGGALVLDRLRAAAPPYPVEAVHRARVALRRLRSVLSMFRPVVGEPAVAPLDEALRALARRLGAVRDWDVFLGGICETLATACPGDSRLDALRAAGHARRATLADALTMALDGDEGTRLAVELSLLPLLRPWEAEAAGREMGAARLAGTLPALLDRRLRQVAKSGKRPSRRTPETLHDLRKKVKRLRYAADLAEPLHAGKSVKRFLRRLEAAQETLGRSNDATVAGHLLDALGGELAGGYASGLVRGYAIAEAAAAARHADRHWRRLRRATPFWR